MYATTYEVLGHAPFPVDMLRYDGSYPADQEGASDISRMTGLQPRDGQLRTIRLTHLHQYKNWTPTEGRWNSFGWGVGLKQVVKL